MKKEDVLIDEIMSIEECGEEETIDISVNNNHLFFANGILTHNSGYNTSAVDMDSTSDSAVTNMTVDFLGALYQQDGDKEANKLSMKVLKNRLGGYQGKVLDFHVNYNNLNLSDPETQIVNNPNIKNLDTAGTSEVVGDITEV
jgi:hypothetical protein